MSDHNHSPTHPPRRRAPWWSRLLFWGGALLVLGVALFIAFGRLQGNYRSQQLVRDGGAAHLGAAERFYLQTYLVTNIEGLGRSVGSGHTAERFVIEAGQGASQVADQLIAAEVLAESDKTLFLNYLRYYGYDRQLEAGNFRLPPTLTIPELARTLLTAVPDEIVVTFLEGWRVEEMADYLRQTTPAQIDADQFLAIAQRRRAFDLTPYDFLASHPPSTALEGFLFPDTYRLPLEADAPYLVDLMLRNFGARLTPTMRQAFGTHDLTLYEAVTLASIVQREAVRADERPLIAGVFMNRLELEMLLQADPTVQYAIGYWAEGESWWKSPLWREDLQQDLPHNTYRNKGLPPSPIANPGQGALEAVAFPAESDYLFFVAGCGAQRGAHLFGVTYEDHLANIDACS